MADIFVARSGTPEALTADYVCDGTADEVEINAAIAEAAASGGGTVHLAAGVYSTARPVTVLEDNVTLEGAGADATVIRPAAGWISANHPNGAGLTGAVTFA